jgi:hypothetical protein
VSVLATVGPADEVMETEPMKTLIWIPLDDDVFQNTYDATTEFGILHASVLNRTANLSTKALFTEKEISGNGSKRK